MAKAKGMGPKQSHPKIAGLQRRKTIEYLISYDPKKKRYYVYHNYDGKKVYTTHTSYKSAEAEKDEYLRQQAANELIVPKNDTLIDRINAYVESKRLAGREATTLEDYNKYISQIKKYEKLNNVPIQKIKTADIRNYLTYLLDTKKYKRNTIRKHQSFLNAVFKQTRKERIITLNPMDAIELPRKEKTCADPPTLETVRSYYDKAKGTPMEVFILLLILGLRRGEIAGLQWKNVDFENNTIKIVQSRSQTGSVVVNKDTKTSSGNRTMPMPPVLREALVKAKNAQKIKTPKIKNMNNYYVVGNSDGSPYRPNYLDSKFKDFVNKNSLPSYRMHDFRHFVGTFANDNQLSTFDISKALGHASPSITSQMYTHQTDINNTRVISKVFDALDIEE